ncbi:large ribosomal subunit protein mL63 [Heteronotia binoei]|uniref:large ribosomal subunit protein mL63 n=1 Tax=Heteronotia binoei TaxID=13085 RepID=UPI00292F5BAC|nr:large ribosomal subunit protein mL63 [Heteronotia binoei]XP_060090788.1 large ribosomal subunit protein mL63 [Heteronotia binoei]XP_060090789.1 large ribosomal subunit protein mL63 [Heteronotia binoei]XP_060090790.1 large ribosomal subunit protein mL63 [Heteronotia binoei]
MFLTLVLLRNKIPGHQWIGKHRRPREVTMEMKCKMIKMLEIEAENEYWLSRPYMTREQEYRHNEERRQASTEAIRAARRSNFPEHKYATEHLNHLNVTKKWESS